MDIGSAVGRESGVTEEQLLELAVFQTSEHFTEIEKLVLEFATALTKNPVEISEDVRIKLGRHLSKSQMLELSSAIVWENHRARLNRALGIRSMGFSEGAFCVLPVSLESQKANGDPDSQNA